MQGRLRGEAVSVGLVSECAHCKRTMRMEIDGEMNCRCQDGDCHPIIFVPEVDFQTLKDPSIIDSF